MRTSTISLLLCFAATTAVGQSPDFAHDPGDEVEAAFESMSIRRPDPAPDRTREGQGPFPRAGCCAAPP